MTDVCGYECFLRSLLEHNYMHYQLFKKIYFKEIIKSQQEHTFSVSDTFISAKSTTVPKIAT